VHSNRSKSARADLTARKKPIKNEQNQIYPKSNRTLNTTLQIYVAAAKRKVAQRAMRRRLKEAVKAGGSDQLRAAVTDAEVT